MTGALSLEVVIRLSHKLDMRTPQQKHRRVMDSAKIDAQRPLPRPHRLRPAGIVVCPNISLHPKLRELVGFWRALDRQPDRKLAINNVIPMCFPRPHDVNV